jgi:hypothetical protein
MTENYYGFPQFVNAGAGLESTNMQRPLFRIIHYHPVPQLCINYETEKEAIRRSEV